jgi:hypothetical protein
MFVFFLWHNLVFTREIFLGERVGGGGGLVCTFLIIAYILSLSAR